MTSKLKVSPYAEEVVIRLLSGQKFEVICDDLGLDAEEWKERLQTPYYKRLLTEASEDRQPAGGVDLEDRLKRRLYTTVVAAYGTLENMMIHGKSEETRRKIADKFLDRYGGVLSATQNISVDHNVNLHELSTDQLRKLVTARVGRIEEDAAIEAQYEQIEYEESGDGQTEIGPDENVATDGDRSSGEVDFPGEHGEAVGRGV